MYCVNALCALSHLSYIHNVIKALESPILHLKKTESGYIDSPKTHHYQRAKEGFKFSHSDSRFLFNGNNISIYTTSLV